MSQRNISKMITSKEKTVKLCYKSTEVGFRRCDRMKDKRAPTIKNTEGKWHCQLYRRVLSGGIKTSG